MMQDDGVTEKETRSGPTGKSGRKVLFTGVPCNTPEPTGMNRNESENVSNERKERFLSLTLFQESVFSKNPLPILILDPSFHIRECNEAFTRVSGISQDNVSSMEFQDFNIVSRQGGDISDVPRYKRHVVSEVTLEFPSGMHTFEQYSIPMMISDGEINGIMVVLYDKTMAKQEKDQLTTEIKELKSRLEEEIRLKAAHTEAFSNMHETRQENISAVPPGTEQKEKKTGKSIEKTRIFDVVEFELCGERYALDINLAREIVEMMPVTPIPCSPGYLRGIMNLRGEITNIITITGILGLKDRDKNIGKKIIILSSDATGGENIGVIVDDVQSVIQVRESDVEHFADGPGSVSTGHIKGIIKIGNKNTDRKSETGDEKDLVIWIDMLRVIGDLTQRQAR